MLKRKPFRTRTRQKFPYKIEQLISICLALTQLDSEVCILDKPQIEKLESFIREKMFETNMPGLTLAMRDASGERLERAFGFSDIRSGIEMTPDTCFCIGSITKSFTAISVLRLSENGSLSLKDNVGEHIPKLRGTAFDGVTIHNLLSHTSGVSTLGSAERKLTREIWGGDSNGTGQSSAGEEFYSTLRHSGDWIVGPPGSRFSYLNEGYRILHDIVEESTGESYEKYVTENILMPIGMTSSFFMLEKEDTVHRKIASPYSTVFSSVPTLSLLPGGTPGSGSLFSNVQDMSKYAEMLINRGRSESETVLNETSLKMMEDIHVETEVTEIGKFGERQVPGMGYGYGLNVNNNFFGHKLLSHGGSVFVYTSYLGYEPETQVYTVLLSNTTAYPLGNLGRFALALSMGKDPHTMNFLKSQEILRRASGTYHTYRGTIKLTIRQVGEFLEIRNNYSNQPILLIPEQLDEESSRFYSIQGFQKIYAEFSFGREYDEVVYSGTKYKKFTTSTQS